jgi:hypothetical protein
VVADSLLETDPSLFCVALRCSLFRDVEPPGGGEAEGSGVEVWVQRGRGAAAVSHGPRTAVDAAVAAAGQIAQALCMCICVYACVDA